jgi:hypothetical protein
MEKLTGQLNKFPLTACFPQLRNDPRARQSSFSAFDICPTVAIEESQGRDLNVCFAPIANIENRNNAQFSRQRIYPYFSTFSG